MQNIGLKIKTLREERKMTQLILAEKAGIDNSLISRIESGETKGSLNSITKIATVLGVTIAELLDDDSMPA